MENRRTIKEKLLAILLCLVLFAITGALLSSISISNKKRNEALHAAVRQARYEAKLAENFAKLTIDNFDSGTTTAKSILSVATGPLGLQKTILEKNADQILPIASITKLMSAIIVLENIDLKNTVLATGDYVGGDGTFKTVEIGKVYTAKELLNNMLIASDNDSAQLLASIIGTNKFIALMNHKAKSLGLENTNFINMTGLDPLIPYPIVNTSTARDLTKLMFIIKDQYPQIFKITTHKIYNFCSLDGICKEILNTNKLLNDKTFTLPLSGAKTGQTDIALRNFILISQPFNDIFLVNVVLGSMDHFADTKHIINQLKLSHGNN